MTGFHWNHKEGGGHARASFLEEARKLFGLQGDIRDANVVKGGTSDGLKSSSKEGGVGAEVFDG